MLTIKPNGGYMPQQMKRNVRAAYDYCSTHDVSECKVNTMRISFNMDDKTGEVEHKESDWGRSYTAHSQFAFEL